ncbi:MAG: TatD family hydrolase [Acidimicrobiales bacterium]
MSGWVDSHCHLQDRFVEDRGAAAGEVAATLARARAAGVERAIVIGTDVATSREGLALAAADAPVELYATVGLHPHEAVSDLAPVADLARAGHPRLVGIGECGLDYFYEHSPRARQLEAFAAQVRLAHELDLALVIHARDAFDDLLGVLGAEGTPARAVVHCFTGTPADAENCLAAGCDISVSGIVTFKKADALRDAVRRVPLERLHVETDSPFLAPMPHRGSTNEPAYVAVVGAYVADLRGEQLADLRAATAANTARLFRLPGASSPD